MADIFIIYMPQKEKKKRTKTTNLDDEFFNRQTIKEFG